MNKKFTCDIIFDLLPLYAEKMVKEETALVVSEHICECQSCREIYNDMKEEIDFHVQEKSKKRQKHHYRKKSIARRLILGYLLLLLLIVGFCVIDIAFLL